MVLPAPSGLLESRGAFHFEDGFGDLPIQWLGLNERVD